MPTLMVIRALSPFHSIGRDEKLTKLSGQVLADNHEMHHICRKVGFKVVHDPDSNMFNATYTY